MKQSFITPILATCLLSPFGLLSVQADFFEDFDSFTPEAGVPSPWANDNLVSGTSDLLNVTPAGAGYNGTLGAHGPSPNWWEAGQPTNYDTGELVHVFSYKAHLSPANGIPRVNAGVGKAVSGELLFFEMEGGALTIAPSIGATTFPSVPITKGPWYEISVTLVNDGGGNWSWSGEVGEDTGGGTFVPYATMPGGALPAGYAPESVQLNSIFSFVETGGTSALDDVSFAVIPEPASILLVGLGLLALRGRRQR